MHGAALFAITELQWRSGFSLFVGIFVAFVTLAAFAGVLVLYVKEAGRLNILARLFMAFIRMSILTLMAILLFHPVLVFQYQSETPRPIGVLIDVSESMGSKDPRPNTADQWRVALAYGKIEPNQGLPTDTLTTPLNLPEKPSRLDVARERSPTPSSTCWRNSPRPRDRSRSIPSAPTAPAATGTARAGSRTSRRPNRKRRWWKPRTS